MPPTYRDDPYGGYNFIVTLNGVADDGSVVRAGCNEVSGLEAEVGIIEYRNGNEDITVRKNPGLKKFTNLTLKRGMTGDLAFWNWIRQAMKGKVQRVQGSIAMLDENRQEVLRWTFTRAWPSKFTGPGYNAANNETAFETLEVCHEGLSIDGEA
jgi:phage tail-like protein